MVIRFTDNILENMEGTDFVIRKRVPRVSQVIAAFIISFILITLAYMLSEEWSVRPLFTITLVMVISILCLGAYFIVTNSRKVVISAEFQNAMFASATQIGSRFCLVVHKNGTIAYIDPGFQKIFPNFSNGDSRLLTSLLVYAEVPDMLSRKIITIMQKNISDNVVLPTKDELGNDIELFVTIDPIPRPAGYYIIRGRHYIRKREEDEETLRTKQLIFTHYPILTKAFYSLSGAILVANGKGEIIFANDGMEQLIGYTTEQMLKSLMLVEDILENYPAQNPLVSYEGKATLMRSNNTEHVVVIRQKTALSNGNLSGVIVQLIEY